MGVLQWFWPGRRQHVEDVLRDLRTLGVTHLRTGVSWADWYTPHGIEWYEWLLPRLAQEVEVLPCFLYTPPSLGLAAKSSSPPRDPEAYAHFIDEMITRFGQHFEWMELWNEPNNLSEWDWTLDPEWRIFCHMIGSAAYWARARGKKTVLGGMSPTDPNWLRLMFDRGVMSYVDAVGIHGFPGVWEYSWEGWPANVRKVRDVLDAYGSNAAVWVTEVGFSTWRHEEHRQVREFVKVTDAPVDRVYWYSCRDLANDLPTVDGYHSDEREYHFGLKKVDGTEKLLFRTWKDDGLPGLRRLSRLGHVPRPYAPHDRPVLITGGAGFIGTNLAEGVLESGRSVIVMDNLSGPQSEQNAWHLHAAYGDRVRVEVADVRDRCALRGLACDAETVFHLASVDGDAHLGISFEVNTQGVAGLLEELRGLPRPPAVIHGSSHRIYGPLGDLALDEEETRMVPRTWPAHAHGVNEKTPPDLLGTFACTTGAAEQLVLESARRYGLRAAVLRLGVVYGPYGGNATGDDGFGTFVARALEGGTVALHGNGKHVRDLLYVDDLVRALLLAEQYAGLLRGEAYNVGGGAANTASERELLLWTSELAGTLPSTRVASVEEERALHFVSDTRKFRRATGWTPRVGLRDGIRAFHQWLSRPQEPVATVRAWPERSAGALP